MQIVIVTGMSGAGKSCIMNVLEDIGYYCVDNIPPALLLRFYEICIRNENQFEKIAVAVDFRSGDLFDYIYETLNELKEKENLDVRLLYAEASDEVILRRYKETRRKHPLINKFDGSIQKCIRYERSNFEALKDYCDYQIDTSYLSTNQLKEQVRELFLDNSLDSMSVKVMSFGFKYGVPAEVDTVFDVRCLPNPYYIKELKNHTGCDAPVRDYVMQFQQSKDLLYKIKELMDFLIPLYLREGKSQLVIAFGCTGGKHRSVTFAELLYDYFKEYGLKVQKLHRDKDKDKK